MALSDQAYARQLRQLLPPGRAFVAEPGGVLARLLLGLAGELARVDARADNLAAEFDPTTTDELLGDWERVFSIPGPGEALGATVEARRTVLLGRLTATGGQAPSYFVALAARLGWSAVYSQVATNVWCLTCTRTTSTLPLVDLVARAGAARAGDRTGVRTVVVLEAAIRRFAPAHTLVWFAYP